MTIQELLTFRVKPFDINDKKLISLFSFFLHSAPTIDNRPEVYIPPEILEHKWDNFIKDWGDKTYRFYSPDHFPNDEKLEEFNLAEHSIINRKSKAIVCSKRDPIEPDYECLLRHVRNAIAHGYVFLNNRGNRKYILMQDFNTNNKLRAMILMSQAELQNLKKYKQ